MPTPLTIQYHFRKIKDPRINRHKRHQLLDIILLALCAVLCGAKDWQQVETFGKERLDWFRRFRELANGIPSHDTFERVFDRIDPQAFHQAFQQWVAVLADKLKIKHIAIDGKTLRGSGCSSKDLGPLHLVRLWATEHHLSLGQVATAAKSNEITAIPELLELLDVQGALVTVDAMGCQKAIATKPGQRWATEHHLSLGQVATAAKSNEITAIPELLELLDVQGALVTVDAMGCQKAIATKIVEGGGDYALMLKDNQPNLLEDAQTLLGRALDDQSGSSDLDHYSTFDKGHGRTEKRHYTILRNPEGIRNHEEWKNLRVIGMCVRERQVGKADVTTEVAYFIGSRVTSAKVYGQALRNHWGIENNLHWQLDVSFAEDDNRFTKRNGAENLSLLRRIALMLLKHHPSKLSIAGKQWKAALNSQFLEEVLSHNAGPGKL